MNSVDEVICRMMCDGTLQRTLNFTAQSIVGDSSSVMRRTTASENNRVDFPKLSFLFCRSIESKPTAFILAKVGEVINVYDTNIQQSSNSMLKFKDAT